MRACVGHAQNNQLNIVLRSCLYLRRYALVHCCYRGMIPCQQLVINITVSVFRNFCSWCFQGNKALSRFNLFSLAKLRYCWRTRLAVTMVDDFAVCINCLESLCTDWQRQAVELFKMPFRLKKYTALKISSELRETTCSIKY